MTKKGRMSIINYFAHISIGTIFNIVIGLITVPVITRIVDPIQYGQLSIFMLYADIAVMIFCIGLDQALVRFFYEINTLEFRQNLLGKCWKIPVLSWIFFSIIFIIAYIFFGFEFEFDLVITIILCAYILFQIFNRFSFLIIRLKYKTKIYAILNVLQKSIFGIIIIIPLYLINGSDLLILTLGTTVSFAVVTIIGIIIERNLWFNKGQASDGISTIELVRFGSPFILSMGITTVFQGIDKLTLNYFYAYEEVGVYSAALNLIKIFAIVQTSFNALWAPMAMKHFIENKEDRAFYQKGCSYITVIMFTIGLFLILGKDLFASVLGEKYRIATYIFPCLIFNPIMYTISETTCTGIDFAKKSKYHIIVAAGACFTNIIGNLIMVPLLGAKGASISTGLAYIAFFALRTFFSKKAFPVNYSLKRFSILTIVVFIYALHNTFMEFNLFLIFEFLACILLMCFLYIEEINEMCVFIKKILKNERKR